MFTSPHCGHRHSEGAAHQIPALHRRRSCAVLIEVPLTAPVVHGLMLFHLCYLGSRALAPCCPHHPREGGPGSPRVGRLRPPPKAASLPRGSTGTGAEEGRQWPKPVRTRASTGVGIGAGFGGKGTTQTQNHPSCCGHLHCHTWTFARGCCS